MFYWFYKLNNGIVAGMIGNFYDVSYIWIIDSIEKKKHILKCVSQSTGQFIPNNNSGPHSTKQCYAQLH